MTTSENLMSIVFRSDHSVAGEGFTASYVIVNSSTACGGNYLTTSGVLRSPGYPSPYGHNRDCEWTITVDQGNQILLNVTEFELEHHSNCNFDYLEIRNGGYSSSPLIGRFCGSEIPPVIPSFSNQLYLRFKSDS